MQKMIPFDPDVSVAVRELLEQNEVEVRKKIVKELRSSAFLYEDVNKEDVLLCIKTGKTLIDSRLHDEDEVEIG